MNPTQPLLTESEVQNLTRNLVAGEKFHPISASYIALAVEHALKDPNFVILFGTFAVDQLHMACE